MKAFLKKLIKLLEGEIGLYGSLLLVLQKEKRAIVDSSLEGLNRATKEKENLVLEIRILEEERSRIHQQLAERLQEAPHEITLTRLAGLADDPEASQLSTCQSSLSALMQSIQEINNANKTLVSHSLRLIRGSLNLLSHSRGSGQTYFRDGQMRESARGGQVLSGSI